VAIADLDTSRVEERAGEWEVAGYTDDNALLDTESIDAIHVCTPPATHVPIALDALDRDVAVLIEKPTADSAAAVETLMDAAADATAPVSVVHNRLFLPPVQRALAAVNSGAIGSVVSVELVFGRRDDLDETIRGDWVFDMASAGISEGLPHKAYLSLAFADRLRAVQSVTHRNRNDYDRSAFDGLAIEAVDESEAMISTKILADSATRDQVQVTGTEGTLTLDLIKLSVFLSSPTGGHSTAATVSENLAGVTQHLETLAKNATGFLKRRAAGLVGHHAAMSATPHYVVIDRFYESVLEGTAPLSPSTMHTTACASSTRSPARSTQRIQPIPTTTPDNRVPGI
jgi:predicted dehydrogenase